MGAVAPRRLGDGAEGAQDLSVGHGCAVLAENVHCEEVGTALHHHVPALPRRVLTLSDLVGVAVRDAGGVEQVAVLVHVQRIGAGEVGTVPGHGGGHHADEGAKEVGLGAGRVGVEHVGGQVAVAEGAVEAGGGGDELGRARGLIHLAHARIVGEGELRVGVDG